MRGNYRRGGFVHQLNTKNDYRNPKTNLKPAHHSQETPKSISHRCTKFERSVGVGLLKNQTTIQNVETHQ